MQSRMRLARHPLHPMLVMFPTAIFPGMLLLDAVYAWRGNAALWEATFWLGVAGVVTTLAAMVPGIVDLAAIPDGSKAHRTALIHFVFGTLTLFAYAAATWARWPIDGVPRFGLAVGLDVVGLALISIQGWLGGELVYKHHIGVLKETEGADPVELTSGGDAGDPSHVPGAKRPG